MKRLLSLVAIFLVSLVGMVGVSTAADKAIQAVITQLQNVEESVQAQRATVHYGVQVKPKMYYLTNDQVPGDQATAACSTGFHMASIFEILDTSNLQYASGLPGASSDLVNVAQGDAPAMLDFGWVRTGNDPVSYMDIFSPELTDVNCNNWTGETTNDLGTVGRLYVNDPSPQTDGEWTAVCVRQCAQTYPVWCVENM